MLRIRHSITITQVSTKTKVRDKVLSFPFVNDFDISRSFDNQTQTATIRLPKNIKYQNETIYSDSNPLLLRGDKVKIECGYYPTLTTVFEGYISKISNNIPIEIKCEDEMFLLKQIKINNLNKKEYTLQALLKEIIPSTIKYNSIKTNEFKIKVSEASISKILSDLRSKLGIFSFFQNGVLRVGLPFYEAQKKETFLFEKVIIKDDMEYMRSEDVKVQVKGVIIKEFADPFEKTYGDSDGSLVTLFQVGGSVSDLDRKCKQRLTELNYTGYYGEFTTFLEPAVNPGDQAIINSYKMPERNGTYLIKSVETSCGVEGGRQKIELERRLL